MNDLGMKQEFITLEGRISIERDLLYIKRLKYRQDYEHYRYLAWMFFAISIIERGKKTAPLAYVMVGITAIILLVMGIRVIYLNKWKSRFHLSRLKSYKVEDDGMGLETKITLYFRSGTAKDIIFRTSEKQHDAFLQLIQQHLTSIQIA